MLQKAPPKKNIYIKMVSNVFLRTSIALAATEWVGGRGGVEGAEVRGNVGGGADAVPGTRVGFMAGEWRGRTPEQDFEMRY